MTYGEAIDKIKAAFPGKAWAYAVEHHQVQIGIWDGNNLIFKNGISSDCLLELRVFHGRELRVVPDGSGGFLLRDSAKHDQSKVFDDLYVLYGEQACHKDGWTHLSESRGGVIAFPKHVEFPNDKVEMKLAVRQFYRYNKVPVLPKGETDTLSGFNTSAQGALEIYDFAFTGFIDANGKEVEP